MALSSALRKLGIIKPLPKTKINVNKDVKAITYFLANLPYDDERLLRLFKEFLELRLEHYALSDDKLKRQNIIKQVNLFDQIIDLYQYFQDDVDINGKRVKNIAKALTKVVKDQNIEEAKAKVQSLKWRFDW